MPTYEYVCTGCGNQLERYQSFTDAALVSCEICAGKLRRVYSPVAVVFKGSGFYSTDARAGKSKAKRESDKEPAKNGASSNGEPKKASSEGKDSKASGNKQGSPAPKKAESA